MSWNAPTTDAAASSPHEPSPRTPYLSAVRTAWRLAREARNPYAEGFALALCLFAHDGRARGVSVDALLHTLDALLRSAAGMPDSAELERVRAWAGAQVIRGYYGAD